MHVFRVDENTFIATSTRPIRATAERLVTGRADESGSIMVEARSLRRLTNRTYDLKGVVISTSGAFNRWKREDLDREVQNMMKSDFFISPRRSFAT